MKNLVLPLLAAAGLCGCGILYTNIHSPRAYRSAAPSEVKTTLSDPSVTGEACSQSVLFLVAWGDAGYGAAVANALKDHADAVLYDVKCDIKVRSFVLGLYTKVCTEVSGKTGHL